MTRSITAPQHAQITNMASAVLRGQPSTRDGAQQLISQGEGFMDDFAALIAARSGDIPSFDRAKELLGDFFADPRDLPTVLTGCYDPLHLAWLIKTLPSEDHLTELQRTGFMMIPGPATELSLSGLYREFGDYRWKNNPEETFAHNERLACRWYAARHGLMVPNSVNQPHEAQLKLLGRGEYVPLAVEVLWQLRVEQVLYGKLATDDNRVRTSSMWTGGRIVNIGCKRGLIIVSGRDRKGYEGLGITSHMML